MTAKWFLCEKQYSSSKYNAGSKARLDVDSILTDLEFIPIEINSFFSKSRNPFSKATNQYTRYREWVKSIDNLRKNDIVVIQFPVRNETVFLPGFFRKLKKRGIKIITQVHDLESLRLSISNSTPFYKKLRYRIQEISALKFADKIIVHNDKMRDIIHQRFDIPLDKMISLEIFDYLYSPTDECVHEKNSPVIVAGNLSVEKSGYIYHLPDDFEFELFGANFDERYHSDNVHYKGKVEPDILPGLMNGSFGLIWDGPSDLICEGVFGQYLKYNNPHKCSLYLAAGLPVIIWKEAALADFVAENHLGLCINSLDEIAPSIAALTEKEYAEILDNCKKMGEKIRSGYFTKTALTKIL